MSGQARALVRRLAGPALPPVLGAVNRTSGRIVGELVANRVEEEPHLRRWFDAMTDEHARLHFGEDEVLQTEHLRLVIRYFHAWRVNMLRERIGEPGLRDGRFLDVGDTDGLMLKHLDQPGIGFNLAPAAIRNIEANGIEARLGDGQEMPFADGEFDYVLCFETLEHVENPEQLLEELARVLEPGGRLFVSIPWVPRTFVHERDFSLQRGYQHIFEFSRTDFGSLVSHSPLEIRFDTVCDVIGSPQTAAQRAFLAASARQHIVGGTFRRFQFFELAHRA